ncbi:MAG: hypothetical protein M9899_01660 [Bdellovibrionaceae bacterium]|nr:hypothetical protein [Pseudobdellovibrionaceae bacterium]
MTQKLLGLMCATLLSFNAFADADHDPTLDEPVQLYVDKSVTTNVTVDVNVQPAYTPNNVGVQWANNVNYYYDNGAPIPRFGSLVPVVINANARLASPNLTPITDLMQFVQYELSKQGYNTNLALYGVQSIRVNAVSDNPRIQSQVALASQNHLIASAFVYNYPNSVILYNAVGNMNLLNWPLNLYFQGQIRLQNITVFLAPLVNTNPGGGWMPYPPPHHYPHGYVQLGKTKIYDKRPVSHNSQTVIFRNYDPRNAVISYPGHRQIVIDVVGNKFVATKVKVEYLDRYGYVDSIVLSSRKQTVQDGNSLVFDVPHGVSVRAVTVDGYSPNIKGSRARVTVGLR